MALSNRPNAGRLGGLPSGPRSRSFTASSSQREEPRRSASATRDYARTRTGSSPSEPPAQLRHQRSYSGQASSSRARGREDAPPLPTLPAAQRTQVKDKLSRLKGGRGDSVTSFSTVSSSTSSSTSTGGSEYTSPATSLDDFDQEEKYDDDDMPPEDKPIAPGFGSSLWGRLAAAAGNLSVSVSKAWESNVSESSGEVTPPGQESRLTRAMKAYHIAQASKPSDLPQWLFDERERGLSARLPTETDDKDSPRAALPEPSRSNTPAAPLPRKVTTPYRPNKRDYDDDYERATMSRASQRLRELRDAKANPNPRVKFVDAEHPRRAGTPAANERSEPTRAMPAARPEPTQASTERIPQTSVDMSGKRPMAQGLPSGVRPRRA